MTRQIERLKVKIDREKYLHRQATSRFWPLIIILSGIGLIRPDDLNAIISGGGSFPLTFFIVTILLALFLATRRLFETRKNLENYYNDLEKKFR